MIHNPLKTKNKWNMIFIAFLLVLSTLLALPGSAFAEYTPDGGGAAPSTSQDLILMLPSGRWAQQIGSITARTEPANDLSGGFVSNLASSISTSTRLILPNMLLMISQACWSTALSLSQFAATFDPINTFGSKLDKSIGTLVDDIMAGGIPAVLIFLGIFGWIGAAAFNIGSSSEMVKRIGVTIVCLATLIFTGAAAAKDGDSKTPTTGSPWWAVSTINSAVNTMAFGLNLDGLADNDSNMMAAKSPKSDSGIQVVPNCQNYLYEMHQQYDAEAKKTTSGVNTSSVTKAVNRMWEETALRSWVTMQWGNPASDQTTTTPQVAANARQAYCHVLESYAHTDTKTQMDLTNKAMGTNIDEQTAKYLFNPDMGFIDPWNGKVNEKLDEAFDRGTDIYNQRAGIFWETCAASGGKSVARKGWNRLIRNIGDDDGHDGIKGGGGKYLREKRNGGPLKHVIKNDSPLLSDKITDNCDAIFFKHTLFHGSDQTTENKDGNFVGLNVGDAAALGWRFDVPNVSGTWREANLFSGVDCGADGCMEDIQAVVTTTDFLYANAKTDTQGALGSMFGAVVNMVVWGLLSLFLIVSKLMLTFCILSLIVAFLVAAFPFGDTPRKVLMKWVKGCVNFAMVGILYSILGAIATCICQIVISSTGMVSSSFFYNLLTGISPALALIVIALTCGMLGLKNPFSIKAIATMAGGGALYTGITRYGRRAAFDTLRNARNNKGSDKKEEGRESSKSNGTGNAHESAEVLRKGTSKNGQIKEGEEKDTKAKDEDEKSEVDKAEGGTIVASENDAASNDKDDDKDADQNESEDEKTLFGGQKWADRDPNTVRGSLGEYTEKTKSLWSEHHDNFNGALAKHEEDEHRDELKYISQGVDPAKAHYYASLKRGLLDVRSKAAYGSGAFFRGASTAMAAGVAVAKSQPLRENLKKVVPIAKTAAKVGVTVAAFSNPVTAGVGVLMAAKMMTNRKTWSDAAHSVGTTSRAARSIATGLPKKAKELSNSRVAQPFISANNRLTQQLGGHDFAQIRMDTSQARAEVNNAAAYRTKAANYQNLEAAVTNYESVLQKQEKLKQKQSFSINKTKLADQHFSWETQGDKEQAALSQEFDQARRQLASAEQRMFPKQTPVQTPKWAVPSSAKPTEGQAKPQLKINPNNPSGKNS